MGKEEEKVSIVFNNAEVMIILLLYPSTLIGAMNDDEHCIMVVLFYNGKR